MGIYFLFFITQLSHHKYLLKRFYLICRKASGSNDSFYWYPEAFDFLGNY